MPAPFSYTLTEAEYIRINQRVSLRGAGRAFLIVAAVLAMSVIYDLVTRGAVDWITLIMLVTASFAAVLGTLWFNRCRARSVYREQASMSQPRDVKLTEDGLSITTSSGTFHAQWRELVMWSDWQDAFVLYVNRAMYLPFPKSTVPADRVNFMRERVVASGLPKPGKLRKASK